MIKLINQVKLLLIMQKNSFSYDELISCGNGDLFGEGNAKLPLPPTEFYVILFLSPEELQSVVVGLIIKLAFSFIFLLR